MLQEHALRELYQDYQALQPEQLRQGEVPQLDQGCQWQREGNLGWRFCPLPSRADSGLRGDSAILRVEKVPPRRQELPLLLREQRIAGVVVC